jgi:hypothetical protein
MSNKQHKQDNISGLLSLEGSGNHSVELEGEKFKEG